RDYRAAMRHRASRARYLYPGSGKTLAGLVDIGHPDSEMAEGTAQIIWLGLSPIVGQLYHGIACLVAISDESERKLAGRIVALARHLHAELVGVEIKRRIEIAYPDHCVQQSELIGVGYRLRGLGHIGRRHRTLLRAVEPEVPHRRAATSSRIWSAARRLGDTPSPARRRTASSYPCRCLARTRSSRMSRTSEAASRAGVQLGPSNSSTSGLPSSRLTRLT